MQGKYYELKDLKVGMTVDIGLLGKITNTRILLDPKTLKTEDGVLKEGKIIFIGDGDYKKVGLSVSDIFPIINFIDETDAEYAYEE